MSWGRTTSWSRLKEAFYSLAREKSVKLFGGFFSFGEKLYFCNNYKS